MTDELGPFELVRELGRGGMGSVHEAVDRRTGERVALKVLWESLALEPKVLDRFAQEAALLARLAHPNVVTARSELLSEGGRYFFAMELVQGKSLAELLRSRGALPPPLAVRVLSQTLEGLSAAHRLGIAHRDLKPSNVLLERREGSLQVRVADFGIAQAADITKLTLTGQILGTPHYMAPEQWGGERGGPLSDLYAAGVIFFEMLEGHPPFRGPSPLAVMRSHAEAPVPPLSEAALLDREAAERFLARAMSKDPAARFPNAAGMRGALLALGFPEGSGSVDDIWMGDATMAGPSPSTRPTLALPRRRLAWRLAAWTAAVIAAGLVAWQLLPARPARTVQVRTPSGTVSGTLSRIEPGRVVLLDPAGREVAIPLGAGVAVEIVQ